MNADPYTDTWRAVAAKAKEIIDASHSRLEANEQSFGESQFLRGRIFAMREILALVQPAAVTPITSRPSELRPKDRSGI
jgi:hypothetical protein